MNLATGTRLGPYELLSPLGAGGMGEVYRARDAKLNRDVAIKILPEAFAREEERVARFKREAQVLASLSHPNIAAIYGLEESNGDLALVVEIVEGFTLADGIAAGPIPLDDALPIARQIAEGLEAAQGQEFEIGQSQVLFGGKPLPARPHDPDAWDVPVYLTSDGKRILLPIPLETDSSRPLTLVTNWTAALKR